MMWLLYTPSRLSLLLIPMLLLPFYAKSQVVLDELKDEKSLDHFELVYKFRRLCGNPLRKVMYYSS